MALPAARAAWDAAADVPELGAAPLHALVFPPPRFSADAQHADEARLTAMDNAQPALAAASLALLGVLARAGVAPAMTAGHSFGELTALWAAGCFDDATFVELARARGRAMTLSDETGRDAGAMAATYLGVFCLGMQYMAVGLLMSALARSQIVAAMLTFLVLGGLFIVGLGSYASTDDTMRAVFEYVGLWSQMAAFAKGIVDTRHLVFDFSLAGVALFLTVRVLQTNRGQ